MPLRAGIQDRDLLRQRHRLVLVLLEQLSQAGPTLELAAGLTVEVRGELGERGQLPILSQVEAELARHLAHRLCLRVAADARDRNPNVERRPLAAVEKVRLEVDLTVRDGDHVGRDEG